MKVFWWQAGLHIEPENDEDRAALMALCGILKLSSLATPVETGNPATSSASERSAEEMISPDAAIVKLGKLSRLTSSKEPCELAIRSLRFWTLPWYLRVLKALRGWA